MNFEDVSSVLSNRKPGEDAWTQELWLSRLFYYLLSAASFPQDNAAIEGAGHEPVHVTVPVPVISPKAN